MYFACDKCASEVKENWTGRVVNIKRIINAWEKKKPEHCWQSLHYKNIFNFTVCIYHANILVVPDPVLTHVIRILFRLLWRKKDCNCKAFETVKRTVVCCALENGGLNMIDLTQMQAAFLLQWAGRLFQAQALDKWSRIFAPFVPPFQLSHPEYNKN